MQGGAACGDLAHLPVTAQPDELCVVALWKHLETGSKLVNPEDELQASDFVMQAGLLMDMGRLSCVSEEEAAGYFSAAQEKIDKVLCTTRANYRTIASAHLLDIFLPAYKAARYNSYPTIGERADQRAKIHTLMDEVDNAAIHSKYGKDHIYRDGHDPCFEHEGAQLGIQVKLAFASHCLEEGMDISPATSRSQACDFFVTYSNDSDRHIVPVKVKNAPDRKNDRNLPEGVAIFYYQRIATGRNTESRHALRRQSAKPIIPKTLEWLRVVDASNLSPEQAGLLETISAKIKKGIGEFVASRTTAA